MLEGCWIILNLMKESDAWYCDAYIKFSQVEYIEQGLLGKSLEHKSKFISTHNLTAPRIGAQMFWEYGWCIKQGNIISGEILDM